MTFTPIDDQARKLVGEGLDVNLCVEAGAGTGKTTVLVRRIVSLLRTVDATVDEIAVITFTEAAAAEIAARVRQELEAAHADENATLEEKAFLDEALRGLHRARLETIHAFASNLLRERPIEAGLDPAFEVLDALAEQLEFDKAYEAWQDELLASENHAVAMAIASGFDLPEIRKLVEAVQQHRELLPLAAECAPATDIDARASEVPRIAAQLRPLMPLAVGDEKGLADCEQAVRFADALEVARGDEAELLRAVLFNAPEMKPGAGGQKYWDDADDCRACKALRTELRDWINEIQGALRTSAIVTMLPLAGEFVERYERARRQDGKATFDDLLKWARDLLRDSPEARQYARRTYKRVLVDEFQDTDPIQAELALYIASDDEPTTEWLSMSPRSGSLTVVGDPKQSIYRFRGADIAMYDSVKNGPLRENHPQLEQNFRSVGGVLDFANDAFNTLFTEELGVQPANTPLLVADGRLADESRSVCIVRGALMTGAETIRREEARVLAGVLNQAVVEGWPVRGQNGDEKPADWGDIAILVPRRTALDIYLEAFRRAGVPVRAESGRSFFQRQEVHDLSNILQAIDDPLDAISLVAALRSSAFGCSDEDIYLYSVTPGNRLDLRLKPGEDGPESVREALAVLRDLSDMHSRVSLAQLVRAVLEKTRLVEIALLGFDGKQSAANLVKLADKARAFSSAGAGGLRAFARWLADQRAASDETEATVAEESEGVVRLMTIHASKGLEFPIVVLANLFGSVRNEVEPVPERAAQRLHLRVKKRDAEFKTRGFDTAWTEEKRAKEAEQRRLLYVAVTRARDRLIVPIAAEKPGNASMLNLLVPFLDEAPGRVLIDGTQYAQLPEDERAPEVTATEVEVDEALAAREAWIRRRAETAKLASERIEVVPAKPDEGDEPLAAALLGSDDGPLIATAGPPLEAGEALHKVLELVDLRDPSDLEQIARSVCLVAGVEARADEVIGMARACLVSPALTRALAADEHWAEMPYTRQIPEGYATGRMDLVFREGERLHVVDWKSDSVGPSQVAAAVDRHRTQGEAYRAALEAATGLEVGDVTFVFARAGGASASV